VSVFYDWLFGNKLLAVLFDSSLQELLGMRCWHIHKEVYVLCRVLMFDCHVVSYVRSARFNQTAVQWRCTAELHT
jgi:hypothetical protein